MAVSIIFTLQLTEFRPSQPEASSFAPVLFNIGMYKHSTNQTTNLSLSLSIGDYSVNNHKKFMIYILGKKTEHHLTFICAVKKKKKQKLRLRHLHSICWQLY